MSRKLRFGIVGGGKDAFIGAIHRKAAFMDGQIELVCGVFSVEPEISMESGLEYFLPKERIYDSYRQMFEEEARLPEDERMDFVSIVTPNHVHFEPAKLALENGFDVVIEKPLAFSLDEAVELEKIVKSTGKILALTHTYTGYPMVKEARHLVESGKLGNIRKIYVEYPQGWLATPLEHEGNKQASWRTDPDQSGMGGCVGDIGTHAANLAEYVSGLEITKLCADVNIKVPNRLLDDDCAALLKFNNGASGVLMATQVAVGVENDLKLRVYGEKGGLEWKQTEPNTLIFRPLDGPVQVIRTGTGYLSDVATANTRTPAGHPEGYIEAFANIYMEFVRAVRDRMSGEEKPVEEYDFPNVSDGVRGMAFVTNMIKSSKSETKWTEFKI